MTTLKYLYSTWQFFVSVILSSFKSVVINRFINELLSELRLSYVDSH
jgi:hypothetical protein